jgi:hypothetical protein
VAAVEHDHSSRHERTAQVPERPAAAVVEDRVEAFPAEIVVVRVVDDMHDRPHGECRS